MRRYVLYATIIVATPVLVVLFAIGAGGLINLVIDHLGLGGFLLTALLGGGFYMGVEIVRGLEHQREEDALYAEKRAEIAALRASLRLDDEDL